MQEAMQLGHSYTGTEDFLLGLVLEGENVATVCESPDDDHRTESDGP